MFQLWPQYLIEYLLQNVLNSCFTSEKQPNGCLRVIIVLTERSAISFKGRISPVFLTKGTDFLLARRPSQT